MAERIVKNLKDEYFSCRICLDQYHQPKRLSCDHIFCEDCLVRHIQKTCIRKEGNAVVNCPLCRKEIHTSDKGEFEFDARKWVEDLPNDSLISSLMHTLHIHERGSMKSPNTIASNRCRAHGDKPRDAYCFTHANLVCWECAAREHRSCTVDSADKARHSVQPQLETLQTQVVDHLSQACEHCGIDQTFTDSKTKVLNDLDDLDQRFDTMYSSAKRQVSLLRAEVEEHNRKHLDERKGFYDIVTRLLEVNCTLEMIANDNTANLIAALETLKVEADTAKKDLDTMEVSSRRDNLTQLSFVQDDIVSNFLSMYSSIGFVDTISRPMPDSGEESQDAPMSISHILRRGSSK